MFKTKLMLVVIFSCFFSFTLYAKEKPKLILQITVDQLRADLPKHFMKNMGEGGFKYLYKNGIVYEEAYHAHSNTETIVGHTTLSTGAYPSLHGLIGNTWYDRVSGHLVYNIEDSRYPLLSKNADVDKKNEIDYTQKVARTDGRSPANILVTTFSDELAMATLNKSKIFAVSVKDRGAVSMAGHAGKAFWFSKKSGEFVTSKFYYDKYPKWVEEHNKKEPTKKYHNKKWNLTYDKSKYLFGSRDNQAFETSLSTFSRVFPHLYGSSDGKYFNTFLTLSPAGDELTLEFAKELIVNEDIGQDDITDYLSVSFSSTDYVGHIFSPSSLEAEDNLIRLDKTLEELLSFVDKKVGLDNTLIVLSSDHGAAEAPDFVNEFGIEVNYFDAHKITENPKIKKYIKAYNPPYIYLHNTKNEEIVKNEVLKLKGVKDVILSSDLEQNKVANTKANELVLNSHHYQRSGDIFVLLEANYFINHFDSLDVSSMHGSAYSYDTFVPIIFVARDIKAQKVYRKVETVDVAKTLSSYLEIKPPSAAIGNVLYEVLENKKD